MIWILASVSSSQETNWFCWGGGAVETLCREQITDKVEVFDQLSEGQKAFGYTLFHTINLQKPKNIEFFQILSHLAEVCFLKVWN